MSHDLTITVRQRNLILLGTLLGMLVAAINQTTVTTVLPTIAADLDGLNLYTWVFTISMLASAVAVPIFGKLSDLYGRRRLYIAGCTIFMVGAAACALAPTMELLIAARAVQGIGMGAIMPLAMAIIADVVPAAERGKWQGVMGAVFGLATVLGPLAGGAISDAWGWRWIFWVNVPLGIIALATIVTQMHIPFVPRRARIDWLGAITFGGSLSTLLLALSEGGTSHPWSSPHIVGLLVASAVLLVAFVFVERRAADPIIPMKMVLERNVATTSIAGLCIGAGMFTAIFYVPLFMQAVVGVSSADSGLALVPLMGGLIMSSTISGIVISRTHAYKGIIVVGPLIAIAGLWLMSQMGPDVTVFDAAWRMFIVGTGIGLAMQNLVLVAQNSVELRDTGVVTSLATLVRSVGGTVGIALLGTFFATNLNDDIANRVAEAKVDPSALASISSTAILDADARAALPTALQEPLRLGIADSLLDVFLIGIPFLLLAFGAALLLRRDPLADSSAVRVVREEGEQGGGLTTAPVDAAPEPPVAAGVAAAENPAPSEPSSEA